MTDTDPDTGALASLEDERHWTSPESLCLVSLGYTGLTRRRGVGCSRQYVRSCRLRGTLDFLRHGPSSFLGSSTRSSFRDNTVKTRSVILRFR